jgi:tRNA threonylcarbamoyladenosine biosynthesis protein TsaB
LLSNAGIALKQLDVLAVTNGPGSFTGIRLGLGVIQGLAYGANLPVCTVSTLAVLSQGIYRIFNAKNVLPVIDARMKQIYYGLYKLNDKLMTPVVDDNVSDPDKITLPYCQDLVVAGTGLKYCDIMKKSIGYDVIVKENEIYPSAQDLIPFVEHYFKCKKYISPEDVIPNYLRDKVVI